VGGAPVPSSMLVFDRSAAEIWVKRWLAPVWERR
jgi:hypothetical protein